MDKQNFMGGEGSPEDRKTKSPKDAFLKQKNSFL